MYFFLGVSSSSLEEVVEKTFSLPNWVSHAVFEDIVVLDLVASR